MTELGKLRLRLAASGSCGSVKWIYTDPLTQSASDTDKYTSRLKNLNEATQEAANTYRKLLTTEPILPESPTETASLSIVEA
ncbi:hypothetical protein AKJ16_DCAP24259 [Drosera capensis]